MIRLNRRPYLESGPPQKADPTKATARKTKKPTRPETLARGLRKPWNQIELDSEAPLARVGRPTTTAATEAGRLSRRDGLAEVRHIGVSLRRVEVHVNQYEAAKIGCAASRKRIHEGKAARSPKTKKELREGRGKRHNAPPVRLVENKGPNRD